MFKWFSKLNKLQKLSVIMAIIAVVFTFILVAVVAFKGKIDAEFNNPVVSLLNAQKDSGEAKEESTGLELKMDKTEASVEMGKTVQLTVKIEGETEENKVSWDSSDEKIATVDGSGLVTAKAVGTVTIRAKLNDRKTAISVIKVTEPPKPEPPKETPQQQTSNTQTPPPSTQQVDPNQVIEDEILRLINQERASLGKNPLESVGLLKTGARKRVLEESVAGSDHNRPDGSSFSTIYAEIGYTGWSLIGENVVSGYDSATFADYYQYIVLAQRMYNSWKNSPAHFANYTRTEFNQTGVAVNFFVKDGLTYFYGLQLFAQK